MDAQAILTKIEQDAKDAAAKIQSDVEDKVKTLQLGSQANIEMMEKTMLAQAERDSEQMEERMKRMSDLDNRKALLAQKHEVINEAFKNAKDKLLATKPADRRAFYLRQAVACADGKETLIVGEQDAAWFDDSFLADVNKALKAAGKPGELTLMDERRKGCGGIILSQNGAEISITFDSLLDEARADLEQEAAQILFSE
jgi:vacuolar-type H+-ATPase subunit E/Vma4